MSNSDPNSWNESKLPPALPPRPPAPSANEPESSAINVEKMAPQYRIRTMRPEDIDAVLEIWGEHNLHEGTHTIHSFMAVDPEAFVVAVEILEPDLTGQHLESLNEETAQQSSSNQTIVVVPHNNLDHNHQHHSQSTNQDLNGSFAASSSTTVTTKMIANCCYKIVANSLDRINMSKVSDKGNEYYREGNILGMCCGVFVHPTIAYVGMYAVRPELQGCGIGKAMWRRMMEHVNGGNAGLYSVLEHLTMYRDRAGFKVPDNRQLMIYETDGPPPNATLLVKKINGIRVLPIHDDCDGTRIWWNTVIEYDAQVHGYSREKLLHHVFREPNTAAFVALEESSLNSPETAVVQGYGCIRTNNIGKAMIGPLYAMNDAVAELLMRHLFEALADQVSRGLLYMTLDTNPGGETIANKIGLPKHEELPCFFRVEPYRKALWNQVYCIHTPNFSLL